MTLTFFTISIFGILTISVVLLVILGIRTDSLQSFSLKPSPSSVTSHESIHEEVKTDTVAGVEGQLVLVTKVIDGDTIEIESGQHVRLIGVDTPETVDSRRPVGCFGKEASNEVKRLLEGKQVILEKDVEDMDHYKRLLRYVYLPLPDGNQLFVTDYLIREGFGKALNIPPDDRYATQFYEAQNQARQLKKGLWGSC